MTKKTRKRYTKKRLAKKMAVNVASLAVAVGIVWVRAHFCGGNGECVELASINGDTNGIRDSKNPNGGILTVSSKALNNFFVDIKAGNYSN